jgi:hypothetical protein
MPCLVLLAGTVEEIQAEMQRLSERLKMLKAADADVALIKPHNDDPGGRMLSLMLKWRQQRLHAIESEIKRLEDLADEMQAHADDEL